MKPRMLLILRTAFCTFFIMVAFVAAFWNPPANAAEEFLSAEDTVAAVLTLIDEGHPLSAYQVFAMVFENGIPSREVARDRVKIAGTIFRSSQWTSLPPKGRLDYLRIFLAHGPMTARLQREVMFLAASVEGEEPIGFMMEYRRKPWTVAYTSGDDMPSLLPPWKVLWSTVRRGPVGILKGTGYLTTADLNDLIREKVCEAGLSVPQSGRRSGVL